MIRLAAALGCTIASQSAVPSRPGVDEGRRPDRTAACTAGNNDGGKHGRTSATHSGPRKGGVVTGGMVMTIQYNKKGTGFC